MADLARPSFWKVPREFREASPVPGHEAHLIYPEPSQPMPGVDGLGHAHGQHHQRQYQPAAAGQWGFTPLERAVCSLSSASDAGLNKGDILYSVNDKSISGKSLTAVSEGISRDSSNNLTLGIARPLNPNHTRPLSPSINIQGATQETPAMFRPLPSSSHMRPSVQRLDPHSVIDQERMLFEEQKHEEQAAIHSTPYRSQGVISPKPKVRHDHPTGCYLQMQGYKDAPNFQPYANQDNNYGARGAQQASLNEMVHQIGIPTNDLEVKLPYNSPLGLYSRQNALSELQRNSSHLAQDKNNAMTMNNNNNPGMINYNMMNNNNTGCPMKQPPIRLTPDSLVDGSDMARNLASSPTYQLVQEMEGPATSHGPAPDRLYSPVPTAYVNEDGTMSDLSGRSTPQQSATFKSLMNSLLAHPKV